MKKLYIRRMEERDLSEVLKIYNYYVVNSTATFSIEEIDLKEMEYLAFSGLERFPSFVLLEEGEKIVGYSLFNRYKPREAYDKTAEVTIYMDKDSVGKGYGKEALAHLVEIGILNDFHALLAVVCAENEESIALFKKFGFFECAHFREVGEKFGRKLDVIVLEKLMD
ncbi:MAG: N-acetyltransferase [Vallitaleaceae bacterium]|nr:N-acetyltransferase [Vallitaleaceae bacterium]